MVTVAIGNQKGGVGKTPTTVNLGFALARAGKKVLLADLDPQGSLTEYFLTEQAALLETTIYQALLHSKKIDPIKIADSIDLLPAHDELAEAELKLTQAINGQKRLSKVLEFYDYDYCLIDCPPSLGILTVNALGSADMILIPVKTEIAAQRTLRLILKTVEEIRETGLNPGLKIFTILPTLYDSRKAHHQEILQLIKDRHDWLVYPEPSKETTKYNDATTIRSDVSSLDKKLGKYWDDFASKLILSSK
jgi:chromosome partitioning protein